jgi:hypothetical protein
MLGTGASLEPLLDISLDFGIARQGVLPLQLLPEHCFSKLKKLQGGSESPTDLTQNRHVLTQHRHAAAALCRMCFPLIPKGLPQI